MFKTSSSTITDTKINDNKQPFSLDDELLKLSQSLSQNSNYVTATKKLEENIEKLEKEKHTSPSKPIETVVPLVTSEKQLNLGKFRLKVPQAHLISTLQNTLEKLNTKESSEILRSDQSIVLNASSKNNENNLNYSTNENNSKLKPTSDSPRSMTKSNSFEDFQFNKSNIEVNKLNLQSKIEKCGTTSTSSRKINDSIGNFVKKKEFSKLFNDSNLVSVFVNYLLVNYFI